MRCTCGRGFLTPRARSIHRIRSGHPLTVEALLDRTDRRTGCWVWTGKTRGDGYGVTTIDGREVRVTRVVWTLLNGTPPAGLSVLHRCDNPPCVRPAHLFLGTHADNMADMKAKGRSANARTHDPVTECIRGHAFDDRNTAYDIKGRRRCRACSRARNNHGPLPRLFPRRAFSGIVNPVTVTAP